MAKNKNTTQETGRSMVEMLGVLAVIGVLSITGISGYTTAMNKHKANQILDAASKRAVAVSTQIQRGSTSPTLAEFEDNTLQGATFGTPVKVGDNQFKLPVTWASDSSKTTIGAQIKNIAGDGTGTVLIDSDVTRFLYNNDLSAGVSNTNNRDPNDATKCASGYKGTDCDSCDTGYGMHDGSCVDCSTVSATGTSSSVPATGYTGCYCTSDQTWENNECKSAGTPYRRGLIKKYHWSGTADDSLYSDITTPKPDSVICPSGYRWAVYDDVKNLSSSKIGSIFTNEEVCSDCNLDAYSLKDCPNSSGNGIATCGSAISGLIWAVDPGNGGRCNSTYYRNSKFYALCVK